MNPRDAKQYLGTIRNAFRQTVYGSTVVSAEQPVTGNVRATGESGIDAITMTSHGQGRFA